MMKQTKANQGMRKNMERIKWILLVVVMILLISLSLLSQAKAQAQEFKMEDPLVGEWKLHVRNTFYHGDSIQWDWTEINHTNWRIARTEKGLQVVNLDGSAPEFDAFFTPGETPQSYDYQVDFKVEDGKAGAKAELRNNFIHYAFDQPEGPLRMKHPNNPDARMHWEFFWEKTGNLMEVDELFLGDLDVAWQEIAAGDEAFAKQQWESAIVAYTQALKGGFNNAYAYRQRGSALFYIENYPASLSDLSLNYILTGSPEALQLLSFVLLNNGYPELAIKYLNDYQTRDSFTPGLYKKYASALFMLKKFEWGLKMADAGLKQFPEFVDLIYLKGRILMELDKTQEACDCWGPAVDDLKIKEMFKEYCEGL